MYWCRKMSKAESLGGILFHDCLLVPTAKASSNGGG